MIFYTDNNSGIYIQRKNQNPNFYTEENSENRIYIQIKNQKNYPSKSSNSS